MTADPPADVRFENADDALAWLRDKGGPTGFDEPTPRQLYGAAAKVVHAETPRGQWSEGMDRLEAAYRALKREDMW